MTNPTPVAVPKFTEEQLKMYASFERVRKSNKYNMLSQMAANAARLTKEEHLFVIKNIAGLKKQYVSPVDDDSD